MTPKHLSEQIVKQYFTTAAVVPRPTSWEVALHIGDPGTAGNSLEVTDGNYERMPVSFATVDQGAYWDARNTADINFPAASLGASYTVTHFSIRDGSSGALLGVSALPVPIPVVENGVISFAAGDLIVRGV